MEGRVTPPSVVGTIGDAVGVVRALLAVVPGKTDVRLVAGTVAFIGILPLFGTRLALNAPASIPVVASGWWQALAGAAALAGPAFAALVLGVADGDVAAGVGLAAAGTLGLFALGFPAASVAGIGAVVAGAWLVGLVRLHEQRRSGSQPWTAAVVAGGLLVGLALSLAGTVGVLPGALRPAGSVLALAGVASTPTIVKATRGEAVAGGLVAVLVLSVGAAAPFVTGAVVLAVGSVIGAPLLLIALAAGGAASTTLAGIRRDRTVAAAGGLLLATGVPTTLPRALAVTVAVALLLDSLPERPTGGDPA